MRSSIFLLSSLLFFACEDFGSAMSPEDVLGHWRVIAFDRHDNAAIFLSPSDSIFVVFELDGNLSGYSHGMCSNYFSGSYQLQPLNGIQIGSVSSTKVLCPSSEYWQILDVLKNANRVERKDFLLLNADDLSIRLWLQPFE